MKRRTLKKEISELAQRLSPITSKYLAASTRVHQDVIFDYQRMIELHVVDLMVIYLRLDSSWPHKERWLDGLSEEFLWERKRGMIYGTGELFWGHWPEVSREITGLKFTTVLKPCPRHGTEYVFKYWDNQTVRIYSSRHWCRNQQRVKRLERTRHERVSLLSCVGEPLKRIYKASQEKKRIILPGCQKGFCFHLTVPERVFQ